MLLTLYYMAATWMQAWRLSSMRNKITQLLSCNGSLVLYKEPDPEAVDSEGGVAPQIVGVSSKSCINKSDARVGDLLWYSNNKRACSVFPRVTKLFINPSFRITQCFYLESELCLFSFFFLPGSMDKITERGS
ncbi:hypothetical protein C0J52_08932 [Blattella germanica]|nr:hypothetical protein C0J52_08932 [Blattella germanica]